MKANIKRILILVTMIIGIGVSITSGNRDQEVIGMLMFPIWALYLYMVIRDLNEN